MLVFLGGMAASMQSKGASRSANPRVEERDDVRWRRYVGSRRREHGPGVRERGGWARVEAKIPQKRAPRLARRRSQRPKWRRSPCSKAITAPANTLLHVGEAITKPAIAPAHVHRAPRGPLRSPPRDRDRCALRP